MGTVLAGRQAGLLGLAPPASKPAGYSNTKELGRLLYTDYVFPFEIAAVILLVAIVAAIALTLRRRKDTKYQDPARQVRVQLGNRVRLVSMPAENKRDS
jgi:NADH-quinone oxidoreductase subunit J